MVDDSDYRTLHRKYRAACEEAQAERDRAVGLERALEDERAKRRSIERAVRAWADESNHPAMDCPECMALYDIANGRA